jgi:hypothetical protein
MVGLSNLFWRARRYAITNRLALLCPILAELQRRLHELSALRVARIARHIEGICLRKNPARRMETDVLCATQGWSCIPNGGGSVGFETGALQRRTIWPHIGDTPIPTNGQLSRNLWRSWLGSASE